MRVKMCGPHSVDPAWVLGLPPARALVLTSVLSMRVSCMAFFEQQGVAHFVRCTEDATTRALHVVLCDGTSTWTGELLHTQLTPPKRSLPVESFRARLLQDLRVSYRTNGACSRDSVVGSSSGADGGSSSRGGSTAACPACPLSVHSLPATSDVELRWATKAHDAVLGIDVSLKQVIRLQATLTPPGGGLRALLGELTRECTELQRERAQQAATRARLLAELAELDGVVARRLSAARRVGAADGSSPSGGCGRGGGVDSGGGGIDSGGGGMGSGGEGERKYLELLNGKKERIQQLQATLDGVRDGTHDRLDGPISERGSDVAMSDSDDDDGDDTSANAVTGAGAAASSSSAAPRAAPAAAPAPRGKKRKAKTDPTDMLDEAF